MVSLSPQTRVPSNNHVVRCTSKFSKLREPPRSDERELSNKITSVTHKEGQNQIRVEETI